MSLIIATASDSFFVLGGDRRTVDAFTLLPSDEGAVKVAALNDHVFIGTAGNVAIGEFVVNSLTDFANSIDHGATIELFLKKIQLVIESAVKQLPNNYPISSNTGFIIAGLNRNGDIEVCRVELKNLLTSVEKTSIVPGQTSFTALLPDGLGFEECGAIFASCHLRKYGTLDGSPQSCQHSIQETIRIVSNKNSLVGPDSLILQYNKRH